MALLCFYYGRIAHGLIIGVDRNNEHQLVALSHTGTDVTTTDDQSIFTPAAVPPGLEHALEYIVHCYPAPLRPRVLTGVTEVVGDFRAHNQG